MNHETIGAPIYTAVGALLVLTLLWGSRSLLRRVVQRRVERIWAQRRRSIGAVLAEFAHAPLGEKPLAHTVACFCATVTEVLGLDGAALYLKVEGAEELKLAAAVGCDPAPPPNLAPAEAPAVADAAEWYERSGTWLPVVAGDGELGRVRLGRPIRGALDEAELGTAKLLCAHLALAVRSEGYRAELAAERCDLEDLRRRLEHQSSGILPEIQRPENFRQLVGGSEALRRVLALVERMAPSEVAILITGETGTGKELVARAVHGLSPRRDGPMVTVNCPAIPGPLAESELFGHERGAFTDAIAARTGQFELAHGGTIFLDEVADLPLDIQAKLLRVLQEREVRRVGGHKPRPVDVRAIAATNRDLLALVGEGRFREDLYYRLAAVEVTMPPLRVRHGDIPILASFFLAQAAEAYDKSIEAFTPEALAALGGYAWPGNVRQLQNTVHRAVLLSSGGLIRVGDLAEIAANGGERPPNFGDTMRQEKKRRFLEALHQSGWNQSAAARLLGMSRSNLARMLRSLDITIPRRAERGPRAHQYPSSTKLT